MAKSFFHITSKMQKAEVGAVIELAYHKKRHGEDVIIIIDPPTSNQRSNKNTSASDSQRQDIKNQLAAYPDQFRPRIIEKANFKTPGYEFTNGTDQYYYYGESNPPNIRSTKLTLENVKRQNSEFRDKSYQAFEKAAGFFPKHLEKKDVVIGSVAVAAGILSSLQNFELGAKFAMCMSDKISGKYFGHFLTEEDLQTIRMVFAFIAMIVNACINGQSTKLALQQAWQQLTSGQSCNMQRVLNIINLVFLKTPLGLIPALSGVEIFYNSLVGTEIETEIGSQGIGWLTGINTVVQTVTLIRGVNNSIDYAKNKSKDFAFFVNKQAGRKLLPDGGRKVAQELRKHFLKQINDRVTNSQVLTKDEIDLLSASQVTHVSNISYAVTLLAKLGLSSIATMYAYMAYYESGVEAMNDAFKWMAQYGMPVDESVQAWISPSVAIASVTFRAANFIRAADAVPDYAANRYVNPAIISSGEVNKAMMKTNDFLCLMVGLLALTGGQQLILSWLEGAAHPEDKDGCPKGKASTIYNELIAILIADLGVGAFNSKDFNDTKNSLADFAAEIWRKLKIKFSNQEEVIIENISAHDIKKFGKTHKEFMNNFILLMAQKDDNGMMNFATPHFGGVGNRNNGKAEEIPLVSTNSNSDKSRSPQTEIRVEGISYTVKEDISNAIHELNCCSDVELKYFIARRNEEIAKLVGETTDLFARAQEETLTEMSKSTLSNV